MREQRWWSTGRLARMMIREEEEEEEEVVEDGRMRISREGLWQGSWKLEGG